MNVAWLQRLMERVEQKSSGFIDYAVATGYNEIGGLSYPAIGEVYAGQWCAFWSNGGDSVILGPVDEGAWRDTGADVVHTEATDWDVTFTAARRMPGFLGLQATVTRSGADVTGGGLQTVTTVTSAAHAGPGNSGARWALTNTVSTATATLPQIAAFYVPSTGVLSLRIPTGITLASGGALPLTGVVPMLVP